MLAYTKTRFHEVRIRFENHLPSSRFGAFVWVSFLFVFKQGWACLFGGTMLALLLFTKAVWPHHAWLARYDFLFLAALAIQTLLLLLRMETVREAKIILAFHAIGTMMELFKTSAGSWSYPELDYPQRTLFHLGRLADIPPAPRVAGSLKCPKAGSRGNPGKQLLRRGPEAYIRKREQLRHFAPPLFL